MLSRAWTNWLARCLPPGLPEEEAGRARFFVSAWTFGVFFSVMTVVAYSFTAVVSQVVLAGVLALQGMGLLLLFHRTKRLTLVSHLSLAALLSNFVVSAVAQHPGDVSSLAYLTLVPTLATYMLGVRSAVWWVVASVAGGIASITCIEHGWLLPYVDETPALTHSLNFTFAMVMTWLFARTYGEQRDLAQQRLEQADRVKSAFLAAVSHEIRTPMNGVLGMTEVMLQEPQNERQREQLTIIQRSGRLLVSLINDVLDLTKIEAGRLTLDDGEVALPRLVDDLATLYRPTAQAKGLTLEATVSSATPRLVRGDAMRLTQVLGNLVNNAVKFTEHGTVELSLTPLGPPGPVMQLRFSVRDTGIGIAPDVQARLFTAFEQADRTITRRFGGTGLGLSLSQQLVELMGGHIELESTPGKGSRFWFDLTVPVLPTRDHTPQRPLDLKRIKLARVLVVDDNPINLKVAASLVEKAGYQVDVARDGKDALQRATDNDYSAVLMDCHMPVMDGFEATEHIRALNGPRAQVPIIALTASARPEDFEACRRAGMTDFLAKPVTFSALSEALARVVS